MRRVVVAIYVDPDFFPPTINAILNLAEIYSEVIVISRDNSVKDYPYPPNVRQVKIGAKMTVREMEKEPLHSKLLNFYKFAERVSREAKCRDTSLVLLYDPLALFAWHLRGRFTPNKKVWYHNHDMPDRSNLKKYSLGGLAGGFERRAMRFINYFTIPARERLQYYPGLEKDIEVFIIPNYPSLKVYSQTNKKQKKGDLKIIYQGFIGEGHGLEQLVEILNENIKGRQLKLILKGSVAEDYKEQLNRLAQSYNVCDRLSWIGIGPYSEIPALTRSCDLGIGINNNSDAVSQTQGTASNKIYEYAASGIPVILSDSMQFVNYLGKYNWAFFTDGSRESLINIIGKIIAEQGSLEIAAGKDFESELNFEGEFSKVLTRIVA